MQNFKTSFFFKFPELLIVILPFFLITGSFLPDLAIVIIDIIFLVECYKKKLKKYFISSFFIFFIFFYLFLIFSSIISDHVLFSLKISIPYIRFGIFACAVWHYISGNNKILKYLFISILFCFVLLLVDGYIQYIFKQNIFLWPILNLRVSSFFKESI